MEKITTIIVDDEQDSRQMLAGFLTRYCPDVMIAGEASSVVEAAALITRVQPNLVLLDINMPRQNGFELFAEVDATAFYTIFVTAHDEFALKAFQHQAVDYILKPVNIDALIHAVTRAKNLTGSSLGNKDLLSLMQALQRKALPEKISLPIQDGCVYIPIREIIRCEAEGSYTQFYFTNRNRLLVSRNIGTYETILKSHHFIRVHHQHLINPEHVEKYQRGRGGVAFMSDRKEVIVSQRKRDEFLKVMSSLNGAID